MSIPPKLFQTFPSRVVTREMALNVKRLQELNPQWEYHFFDDSMIPSFIASHYGQDVLRAYRRIHPSYGSARADLFRYLALYQYGGVYLDIKSHATKPLEQITRDCSYVLTHWDNEEGNEYARWGRHSEFAPMREGEFIQWFIAASPRHPFLKMVVLEVLRNISSYAEGVNGTGKPAVLRLTGPVVYTRSILSCLGVDPGPAVLSKIKQHRSIRYTRTYRELGLVYNALSVHHVHAYKAAGLAHYGAACGPLVTDHD